MAGVADEDEDEDEDGAGGGAVDGIGFGTVALASFLLFLPPAAPFGFTPRFAAGFDFGSSGEDVDVAEGFESFEEEVVSFSFLVFGAVLERLVAFFTSAALAGAFFTGRRAGGASST